MKTAAFFLIYLHVLAVLWGIDSGVTHGPTPASLLLPLTISVAVVWACASDANRRQTPLPSGVQLVMLLATPFSGALYLIGSRGCAVRRVVGNALEFGIKFVVTAVPWELARVKK